MHGHFPWKELLICFFPRCSREIGGRRTRLWQRVTIIGIISAVIEDGAKRVVYSEFFTSALADGLSLEFERQQVSSSLHDSSQYSSCSQNAVVLMVFTRPPTSKPSSPFNNPLVSLPKAPITTGIIVTVMFHSFFNSLARSKYLSYFSHSFSFILWWAGTAKSTILQILFCCCCCCWLLGLVFWPRLGDLSVCQTPKGVYVWYVKVIIIIIIIQLLARFSHQLMLVSFHWGLSDSKFPRVSTNLLYIFRRSQLCLDGFDSYIDFQFFQSLFQAFRDGSKCTNYNWYHCHLHVPQLFLFSDKVQVLVSLFAFFYFHSVACWNVKLR